MIGLFIPLLAISLSCEDPVQVDAVEENASVLSADFDESRLSSSLLDLKRRHETELRKSVDKVLEPLLGAGHFSVAVTVSVVIESVEKRENRIDPSSQVTISERISNSTSGGTPVGIPGTEANLPEQSSESSERLKSATNYDYTHIETTTNSRSGDIKSVSASVAINSVRLEELAKEGNASLKHLKRNVETSVRSAIGYEEGRDQVTVKFIPFAK